MSAKKRFKKLSLVEKLLLKKNDRRGYQDYKIRKAYHEAPPVNLTLPPGPHIHFKHSGNSGDVIYALPSIYAIAKSNNVHLHLNPGAKVKWPKGVYHPVGDIMLNDKMISMLTPLLNYQPQIKVCDTYTNQPIDVDLDLIRSYPLTKGLGNIARWYFYIFAIQADLSKPWLVAPFDEKYRNKIVLARSHRYRNPDIDFGFLSKLGEVIFVGVPEEYEDMRKMIPELKHEKVNDFLELATVINSSRLFIGNQSFPFSIAEGLKIPRVLEVCYYCPNVNVEGPNGFDFCYQPQFEKTVEQALLQADSSR